MRDGRYGNIVVVETKDGRIAQIGELAALLAARLEKEDPDERQHMLDLCSPAARPALETLSVQALHLLDAIPAQNGDRQSLNVVGLSRATGVPKGTVSKALQRLTKAGLVTRHRLPDNRKEVHVRLTGLGAEVQAAHRSLHAQMGDTLGEFFSRYTEAELEVIARVLNDLVRLPRQGLRFRPDLLD